MVVEALSFTKDSCIDVTSSNGVQSLVVHNFLSCLNCSLNMSISFDDLPRKPNSLASLSRNSFLAKMRSSRNI